MVRVYVPTGNDEKIAAVRSALSEIPGVGESEIVRVKMPDLTSTPHRQPVGWQAIYAGALRRAQQSSAQNGAGYHIGIQSGLLSLEAGESTMWMDQACVYVLFSAAGVSISAFAATATVPVPAKFAQMVANGINELGAIIELYGKREDKDAVAFFSRGFARRRDFMTDALKSAFGAISFNEEMDSRPEGPRLTLIKK
jgi:non-canonical (house-cleaning) NTP pyrophosphatase